jgi:hypothetical protein
MPTRRELLQHAALLAALSACGGCAGARPERRRAYRLGACDWSLGQALRPRVVRARRAPGARRRSSSTSARTRRRSWTRSGRGAYERAARDAGVEIASLALGILNRVPYKSEPHTEAWVRDAVDVARALRTRVVLLAFFERNDLKPIPPGARR